MTQPPSACSYSLSRTFAWPIVVAFAVLAGCGGSGKTTVTSDSEDLLDWSRAASLTAASSCTEAAERLQDHAIVQMELNLEANRRCFHDPNSCRFRGGIGTDAPPMLGAPEAGDDGQGRDAPEDFSETNVQVEGVDEADRVKTDGTHIYTLVDRDFVVLRSWPAADLAEVGRIELRDWPQSFFLDGDRAIVLGHASWTDPEPAVADSARSIADDVAFAWRSGSNVTVIDLADRAAPRIVGEYRFEGDLLDSRRIGNKLYLAQATHVWFDDLEYWPDLPFDSGLPANEIDAAFDALRDRNVERIRARTLDAWLPRFWRAAADGTFADDSGSPITDCTDVHVPSVFSGQNLLSLVTLDLDRGVVDGSTIQGAWGNLYASREAIYIGATNWEFFWWWAPGSDAPDVQTHIHKFAFDAGGVARYSASGKVVGYALNQFSFDEYAGHLRVATTDGFGWWNGNQTESRVTVLKQEAHELQQTGLVTGLGPEERIFGVRFLGERGYVVTFREVDPLYVVDLADPTNPRVAGELKIPGFSSYLHPLAEGFLLTAGRAGDDDGNIGGIKIEVFDVRDPARPQSVTTAEVGSDWNTWSDVLWDHKAFVYFGARNLLAIPVSGWTQSVSPRAWWGEYKSELALFHVTTEAIETLPSISHMGFFETLGGSGSCRGYGGYGQAQIFRGIFADDYVYSLSQLGVQVHDTRSLEAGAVAQVPLRSADAVEPYDWAGCMRELAPIPVDGEIIADER